MPSHKKLNFTARQQWALRDRIRFAWWQGARPKTHDHTIAVKQYTVKAHFRKGPYKKAAMQEAALLVITALLSKDKGVRK